MSAGGGLTTPSIETNAYVVSLDSKNYAIMCYPINPDDQVFPDDEGAYCESNARI
ncbi:MAG: hypothetical protein ACREDR_46360 [Blastocatellia bacterium]